MLGFKTTCHVLTNEVARLTIASDLRFIDLVNSVGEDNIRQNHTKCVDVKEELFK